MSAAPAFRLGRTLLLAATALGAWPGAGVAQTEMRSGDHPGFGRVVFDFAEPTGFDVVEEAGRVLIVFEGAPTLGGVPVAPRNVRSITGGQGAATLVVASGARLRTSRIGNRIVVDVLDPTPGRTNRATRQPGPARGAPPATPAPLVPAALPQGDDKLAGLDAAASAAGPVLVETQAAPIVTVLPEPLPAIVELTAPAPTPAVVPSVLWPADPSIGAASFRRGDRGLVVLDARVPIDLARLSGVVGMNSVQLQDGADSTVLSLDLPSGKAISLVREAPGWRLTVLETPSTPAGIGVTAGADGLRLSLERPGRVVTILDPMTGQPLLVGTATPAAGAPPGHGPARQAPGYALLPTWGGVAVEPLSDQVELRASTAGFVLKGPALSLEADAPAVSAPALFSRLFDFANLPVPVLKQRLAAQVSAAAAAPPRGRSVDRMAVAQTLLSLGLATEAQAVLTLTTADDPAAATAQHAGLMAVAALLAGRSQDAGGLDDPRLDGSDDVTLWRGVRDAMRDTDADAGRALPRLLPLVDSYPAALRQRLRPMLIEAAVATGQAALVQADLAKGTTDGTLDYARALSQERAGENAAALAGLDALAAGRDQLQQVRAGVRAAELRLRTGAITPAQAADVLERQAAIWRGDTREARMRLRAAELRLAAGSFRTALESLGDTERLFPEQQAVVRSAMAKVFAAMVDRPQALPPLELVTLAGEYAPLLPEGTGEGVQAALADTLVALELPARARPVLTSLMAAAAAGAPRTEIGLRIAQLELDAGALPAAQAALDRSGSPGLPPSLMERRGLLQARVQAAQGDVAAAAAGLQSLGTAAADDLRAALLTRAADWRGSLAALSDLAAKTIPANGPLTAAMQDIVLRQATSAVQADDAGALAELRRRHGPRLSGPQADLFRLLTADPVRSPSDLPRTATELALARNLPDRLSKVAIAR